MKPAKKWYFMFKRRPTGHWSLSRSCGRCRMFVSAGLGHHLKLGNLIPRIIWRSRCIFWGWGIPHILHQTKASQKNNHWTTGGAKYRYSWGGNGSKPIVLHTWFIYYAMLGGLFTSIKTSYVDLFRSFHIRGWTVARLPHGGENYIAKLVITRISMVYGGLW